MLMRSMPSVYSPMRGNGITTSSFTLKALVCLLMAAVRCHPCAALLRALLVAVRQKRRPQAQGHSFPARSCIAPARPSVTDGDRGYQVEGSEISSGKQLSTAGLVDSGTEVDAVASRRGDVRKKQKNMFRK
jgi:hypothetical protein